MFLYYFRFITCELYRICCHTENIQSGKNYCFASRLITVALRKCWYSHISPFGGLKLFFNFQKIQNKYSISIHVLSAQINNGINFCVPAYSRKVNNNAYFDIV